MKILHLRTAYPVKTWQHQQIGQAVCFLLQLKLRAASFTEQHSSSFSKFIKLTSEMTHMVKLEMSDTSEPQAIFAGSVVLKT